MPFGPRSHPCLIPVRGSHLLHPPLKPIILSSHLQMKTANELEHSRKGQGLQPSVLLRWWQKRARAKGCPLTGCPCHWRPCLAPASHPRDLRSSTPLHKALVCHSSLPCVDARPLSGRLWVCLFVVPLPPAGCPWHLARMPPMAPLSLLTPLGVLGPQHNCRVLPVSLVGSCETSSHPHSKTFFGHIPARQSEPNLCLSSPTYPSPPPIPSLSPTVEFEKLTLKQTFPGNSSEMWGLYH